MNDLFFLALLAAWSAGVGLFALRLFGMKSLATSDALGLAIPLGLGSLALACLGLGEVGQLNPRAIAAILDVGAVLGAFEAFRVTRQRMVWESAKRRSRFGLALFAFLAWTLAGTLLTALAPVTDGDALCYHLQVPKLFLERGAVFYDPDLHETVYPLLTEMLYAVALAFRGPVACRLVQWLLGVVFALNVTALARPSLGHRAWWAGTIALLVPAISNGMSAPLNDVALAAFGTSAIVAWTYHRANPSLQSAALTGLLTGLAMGVKYPALVLAGLLALTFLSKASPPFARGADPACSRCCSLLAFALTVLLIGGGWYLRAYVHTGNPVHPFFRHVFGGSGLDEVLGAEKRPLPVDVWHMATALGALTLQPDAFDSVSHQFGPVFLLFLPALLLERPPRRIMGIAALGYAFFLLCMTQRQSMRFVLIAIGPLSVAVAWLAQRWWARRTIPARALLGVLLISLGFEASLAVARARHGLNVVIGRESAEHYLDRREPTYRVGRWIDANLPRSARIIGQDHRAFYIPRPYAMELAHRRRTHLLDAKESAEAVVARLEGDGFTHLLLCPPVPENAVEFDPALGRALAPWLALRKPIFREDVTDSDGIVRSYAIFRLADEPSTRMARRGVQ